MSDLLSEKSMANVASASISRETSNLSKIDGERFMKSSGYTMQQSRSKSDMTSSNIKSYKTKKIQSESIDRANTSMNISDSRTQSLKSIEKMLAENSTSKNIKKLNKTTIETGISIQEEEDYNAKSVSLERKASNEFEQFTEVFDHSTPQSSPTKTPDIIKKRVRKPAKIKTKYRKKTILIQNYKTGEDITLDQAVDIGMVSIATAERLREKALDYDSDERSEFTSQDDLRI